MCSGQISRRVKSPFSKCGRITCLLLAGGLWLAAQVSAGEPMLPRAYDGQVDVSGWLMSEKLDGVRGYWDGKRMFSKNGHELFPPETFIRDLPPFPLEGELWGGRGRFEQTVAIVRQQRPHDGWLQLKFAIFDVPQASGGFTERLALVSAWLAAHPSKYAFVIPQLPVKGAAELQRELQRIEALGGEGLIVRTPDAHYRAGRSPEILKVKSCQDAEATVVAHLPGQGRNAGRLGALLVEGEDGRRFRIGSGFSNAERDSPPPVGALVTYKYYGIYQSGLPKFPTFQRIRRDRDL
jgi:DNA ligase 1